MDSLVTILTSQVPGGLSVAQSYLDDNGIYCFLKGELMNQSYFLANSTELQVRSDQVEDAIRLLIEGGFATKEDFEPDETMVEVSKALDKLSSFFKNKENNE